MLVIFAINHFAIEINSNVTRKQCIERKTTKVRLIVKKDTISKNDLKVKPNKSENENPG